MEKEYDKDLIAKMPEEEKLGIFASYLGWAYQFLKQATDNPNSKHSPDCKKSILYRLSSIAQANYIASQSDEPSFYKTNFYIEKKDFETKQERLGLIKSDIFYLAMATATLKRLLEVDPRLAIKDGDSKFVAEEQKPASDAGEMPEQYDPAKPETVSGKLKDYQIYNRPNVENCLKGLYLCQRIIGEEVSTLTERTVAAIKETQPGYGKNFIAEWKKVCAAAIVREINKSEQKKMTPEEAGRYSTAMNITSLFSQNIYMVKKAKVPDSDAPRKSLSPEGPKTPL